MAKMDWEGAKARDRLRRWPRDIHRKMAPKGPPKFRAKYESGSCTNCRRPIVRGEAIKISTEGGGYIHLRCPKRGRNVRDDLAASHPTRTGELEKMVADYRSVDGWVLGLQERQRQGLQVFTSLGEADKLIRILKGTEYPTAVVDESVRASVRQSLAAYDGNNETLLWARAQASLYHAFPSTTKEAKHFVRLLLSGASSSRS